MVVLPRAEASQESDAIKRLKNLSNTIKIGKSLACVLVALLCRRDRNLSTEGSGTRSGARALQSFIVLGRKLFLYSS